MASSNSSIFPTPPNQTESSEKELPLREIPGSYGIPFFSAIKDRYDYFYNQGLLKFFTTRMEKYNSTVFRTNMPPGPFMARNPRVIVLLDAVSFPILFDTTKVEKKNVFVGTYMPSTAFYGNYRPCSYLDPSEHTHSVLKGLILSHLAKQHTKFIPLFHNLVISPVFEGLEKEINEKGKAGFNTLSDDASSEFVFRLFTDDSVQVTEKVGPKVVEKWLLLQLAPLGTLGLKYLPNFIEDFFLHTFPLPFFLVKSDYKKLYNAFYASATSFLDAAEKLGIKRDEACHNLTFLAGFNSYGGMKIIFPTLMKWVGSAGKDLHENLAAEIRSTVKAEGGGRLVSISALEKMSLTKSVVYEALRIEPPVPFQYGKAKEDIKINSHDSSFLIKKDEMIFGYQPIAVRDPKIFVNPGEFIGDRFVGKGEALIKYVYWSNGRETENPTAENKQCPAKDLVVLLNMLLLAEFFLKYDTFDVEAVTSVIGTAVTFTSLVKTTT